MSRLSFDYATAADARDDFFRDHLDAAVTVHCIREMAFHIGQDGIGDRATDDLSDALTEDGICSDDHDAAIDWLAFEYNTPDDWLKTLRFDLDAATKAKTLRAAKMAVGKFIAGLFA